jgi:hypothetical protein
MLAALYSWGPRQSSQTAPRNVLRNPATRPWVLRATVSVAVAAFLPLLDDEAYSWVWSKHLAWGDLDHPPGIAVAIAASTVRFGDLPWAIRLPALLCGLGTADLTWQVILESTRDPHRACLAVVLLQTVPLFSLGAALAVPDGLLAFFWMLSTWALWRAEHGAPGYWLPVELMERGAGSRALVSKNGGPSRPDPPGTGRNPGVHPRAVPEVPLPRTAIL